MAASEAAQRLAAAIPDSKLPALALYLRKRVPSKQAILQAGKGQQQVTSFRGAWPAVPPPARRGCRLCARWR